MGIIEWLNKKGCINTYKPGYFIPTKTLVMSLCVSVVIAFILFVTL